jgi:hypothetical protein
LKALQQFSSAINRRNKIGVKVEMSLAGCEIPVSESGRREPCAFEAAKVSLDSGACVFCVRSSIQNVSGHSNWQNIALSLSGCFAVDDLCGKILYVSGICCITTDTYIVDFVMF